MNHSQVELNYLTPDDLSLALVKRSLSCSCFSGNESASLIDSGKG
ncbi:hypothetical protein [Nostoc sp. MG11]|nr:hypothetical protein [Nostoc sp. MG11]